MLDRPWSWAYQGWMVTDGQVQTLRDAIQHLEKNGMIDFDLGGHEFSHPADVMQGNSADRLV